MYQILLTLVSLLTMGAVVRDEIKTQVTTLYGRPYTAARKVLRITTYTAMRANPPRMSNQAFALMIAKRDKAMTVYHVDGKRIAIPMPV